MGTWEIGNFDNDCALDFLDRLNTSASLAPAEECFDAVLGLEGYIDADFGQEALAAAELVALAKGQPAKNLPELLTNWHQNQSLKPDVSLVNKAIQAIEKVSASSKTSELCDLWTSGREEDRKAWLGIVNELLERLRA